jgi:DNA-binding protein H-NS
MQIKADIEALDAKKQELARTLEAARLAELDAECTDIKKRIIAFGILPHMLFGPEQLSPPTKRQTRSTAGKPYPMKFKHDGNEWTGTGGMPNWFKAALRSGTTPEQMLVPGAKLKQHPKGTADFLKSNGAAKP